MGTSSWGWHRSCQLECWCHLALTSPATKLAHCGASVPHSCHLPSPSLWGEAALLSQLAVFSSLSAKQTSSYPLTTSVLSTSHLWGGFLLTLPKQAILSQRQGLTTVFFSSYHPAGAMEIQVPEEPVVALYGQDTTLHCSFTPEANFSLKDLSLIWQLTDTKRLVHSFSDGRDQLTDQGGGYTNRTALFYDQLSQGNVSLLLRRVEIADEGSFTCFVRVRDYNSAAVTLQVAGEMWLCSVIHLSLDAVILHDAFPFLPAPYSKPNLNLEPNKDLKPGDRAVVTCQSSYGYPEASVLWQDSHGANITENVTTSQVANEEGLFDVYSVLHVLVEPSSTYSCLVRNPVLQQETHASVTITGEQVWARFGELRVKIYL